MSDDVKRDPNMPGWCYVEGKHSRLWFPDTVERLVHDAPEWREKTTAKSALQGGYGGFERTKVGFEDAPLYDPKRDAYEIGYGRE